MAPTVSIGITFFPTSQTSIESIAGADEAMYLAKRTGRDRICTWPMVVVGKAVEDANAAGPSDPEQRRREMLSACQSVLGPAQRKHVTTHCERVAGIACRLAEAIGLQQHDVTQTRIAGLFHDLGKCLVPEDILAEPGPLGPEQMELIRRHASFGADLSLELGIDPETVECIRNHHVEYGRTRALSKNSVQAGLLAVADTWAAMTEDRCYRARRTDADVMRELQVKTGSQFDPVAVQAAVEVGRRAA